VVVDVGRVVVVVLDVLVVVGLVVVVEEVVVGATVVVVEAGAHGPKVPVTSAPPPSGPLLVGVGGQVNVKSLLTFDTRVRLWTPSPGVALAGGPAPVL